MVVVCFVIFVKRLLLIGFSVSCYFVFIVLGRGVWFFWFVNE